ncbi:glutamate receptor ionotropic, kainate 2-like [Tachypleus tridentatus]|uniref:glutamate receptor ionotropic, kainate 2-like n=1 Tax=Tachypleus tridentatus TaxID=6853 RepID=UPI003FD66C4E
MLLTLNNLPHRKEMVPPHHLRLVQVIFSLLVLYVTALPSVVKIGVLMDEDDKQIEEAFQSGVDGINADSSILPSKQLAVQISKVKPGDSYRGLQEVCGQFSSGVVGVVGSLSSSSSYLIQSASSFMEVPYVHLHWDNKVVPNTFSLNLNPGFSSMSQAFRDLVDTKDWSSYTIVYEDYEALIKLKELLKQDKEKPVKVSLRQLTRGMSYRKLVKDISQQGATNIILDISTSKIKEFLTQAREIGMMTEYHNYMITSLVMFRGLTGLVQFDQNGRRLNITLDVLELREDGMKTIGTWNQRSGVHFNKTYKTVLQEVMRQLKNRTLRVVSIINPPYLLLKNAAGKLTGNDQFEGYCVDVVRELSKILGFNYAIHLVRDGSHGTKNENGEWNGMIRELIDREADLALADLTITYEREEAVDFTMPFMNLGISILFRKPTKNVPKLFSFLSPLSLEVWIYMATAYLGVSLLLFILARLTPLEWEAPHPCDPDADVLENQFTLPNSFWFTIGSLMQQGTEVAPKALSTRIVATMWWFFTLIMISSYTANLAAFLTAERMNSPIESAEDLGKQVSIQYGCLSSGSTKNFFKESKIPTYKKMWAVMQARPSVFTESNQEGVERVLEGNYAYLMESTSIEYMTERDCELEQIGGLLDSKGYGIATPEGSPYRTPISNAILRLQEDGVLHLLKEKWWSNRSGSKCKQEEKKSSMSTNELGLASIGGVFVVLLAGLGFACIIALVEFIWKTKRLSGRDRASIFYEFIHEIRSVLCCSESCQQVKNL